MTSRFSKSKRGMEMFSLWRSLLQFSILPQVMSYFLLLLSCSLERAETKLTQGTAQIMDKGKFLRFFNSTEKILGQLNLGLHNYYKLAL